MATQTSTTQASPANHPTSTAVAEENEVRPFIDVNIPDAFSSIVAPKPMMNPHFKKVCAESDAWAAEILGLSEENARKSQGLECAYFACTWVPKADEYGARLASDWVQWIFYFDDCFDEGRFKDNIDEAKKEVDETLALMTDNPQVVSKEKYPIRYMFNDVWQRLCKIAAEGPKERYRQRIRSYCHGVLGQVGVRQSSGLTDVDEYMEIRWRSIGVLPCHPIIEACNRIKVPNFVFEHAAMKECERLTSELIVLANDLASYRKERAYHKNYFHNIINVFERQGLSLQQAMDRVGEVLNDRYRRWYLALADMPIYGHQVDEEVHEYIEGCLGIIRSNAHWHYRNERYLGTDGNKIKESCILRVDKVAGVGRGGIGATQSWTTRDFFD